MREVAANFFTVWLWITSHANKGSTVKKSSMDSVDSNEIRYG